MSPPPAPARRARGIALPMALLLCCVTAALGTAVQQGQRRLAQDSARRALELRARHAADAVVDWVRATGTDALPGTIRIDCWDVHAATDGSVLEIRLAGVGFRHRELRALP